MPQAADVLDLATARLAGAPMTDGAVWGLGRAALRTAAPALLDVLALRATRGRWRASEVAQRLRGSGQWPKAALGEIPAALALANQWAVGGEAIRDQPLARIAYDDILARAGRAAFEGAEWSAQLAVQLPWFARDFAAVSRLTDALPLTKAEVADLRTDLANPFATGAPVTREALAAWLALFNARIRAAGRAPVEVDLTAEHPFDGLQAPTGPSVDGPLVSIIIPSYAPDEGLLNSIRSMAAQSYGNVEMLLVDDASGPAYTQLYDEAAALDPRVRIVRMAVNGGSYLGRNEALNQAKGRFITTQDADDWSHPERIADQVKLLLDNPLAPASRSDAIRALDDLSLQWLGSESVRRNASSLMMRRTTIEQIGVFDTVRKGADSEYHERIERRLGPTVDTLTPLAITRLRGGSLSRSDFRLQWMSPDRVLYRAAFRAFHADMPPGRPPLLPAAQLRRRAFPAPRSFQRSLPGGRPLTDHYDVIYLADLTTESPLSARRDERALLVPEGAKVAVIFQEDPTLGRPRRPNTLARAMAWPMSGRIDLISASDAVTTDALVVLTPGLLEMPSLDAPRLRARRIALAVTDGSPGAPVDLLAALAGGRQLFEQEVELLAITAAAAAEWNAVADRPIPTVAEFLDQAAR
jgi:hypothetical protein